MIVVVDDEDRENEGDLMMAAGMITPEAINFMAMHGRGPVCLAMTGERVDEFSSRREPSTVQKSSDTRNRTAGRASKPFRPDVDFLYNFFMSVAGAFGGRWEDFFSS
jgi:hypothetical protein